MTIDAWVHIGELVGTLLVLWRANRAINRILDALENFPPHRHLPDGSIIFPKAYQPTEIQVGTGMTERHS
jgi:hypothetical protein